MIELPWPPSVNHYWRMTRGRIVISRQGRDYRKTVGKLSLYHGFRHYGTDRLKVTILAYPPDRRRRDLDNTLKAICDSLQDAGVYADDGQIDDLRIKRGEPVSGGLLKINIESLTCPKN